jgi:hypothetical protein
VARTIMARKSRSTWPVGFTAMPSITLAIAVSFSASQGCSSAGRTALRPYGDRQASRTGLCRSEPGQRIAVAVSSCPIVCSSPDARGSFWHFCDIAS